MGDPNEDNLHVMTESEDEKLYENEPRINTRKRNDLACKQDCKDVSYKHKICLYFSRNGYCKFGNTCKYSHRKQVVRVTHNSRFSKSPVSKDIYRNKTFYNQDTRIFDATPNCSTQSKQLCKFFKAGKCDKQFDCKYMHFSDMYADKTSIVENSECEQKLKTSSSFNINKKKFPLCTYFKRGMCLKGDQCKFYHPSSKAAKAEDSSSMSAKDVNSSSVDAMHNHLDSKSYDRKVPVLNKYPNVYDLPKLKKEDLSALRTTEISQLKKRYPQHEVITEDEIFAFRFQPSDPDWPFDARSLELKIHFPEKYPVEKCIITVVGETKNQSIFIPQLLIKYLNCSISNWINDKYEQNVASNKVELVFRPFLKWLDKSSLELFIAGLKKVKLDIKAKEDGIEYVPPEKLFLPSKQDVNSDDCIDKRNSNDESSEPLLPALTQVPELSPKKSLYLKDQNKLSNFVGNDGMKILLSELELTEGAAALVCTKISVTLQCYRCKTSFNVKSVPKKNNSYVCSKCSKNIGFTFEPSTVHQFSNVLGSIHLLDCVAVDINLVECHFLVDCFSCSKQVSTDGIHYGQKHKMWCTFCNEKMMMNIGCVKFQALKLSSISVGKYLPAKKIEKKPKDPIVKEGNPLPDFGTCKHYKKSYRWLRFPCCGRLYPCDECHDEKETDHEMKYASRMICGFCAKEQPYSREKPCLSCSQSLTRKSGSHWEGGKGCRNKISMSREDKHKYSGSCKTISKKAQSSKTKKS